MADSYSSERVDGDRGAEPVRRRGLMRRLAFPLIAFVGGMTAMGYALSRWDYGAHLLGIDRPAAAPAQPASKIGLTADNQAIQPTIAPSGDALDVQPEVLHARIQALEERMDRLSARAAASSGNANRAEGLLVAFAARRAVDRGVQLGYIEPLLRDRFGASQPQAVATVIASARDRVTTGTLAQQFEKIAPALLTAQSSGSWWDKLGQEVSGLFIIRRAGTPSVRPEDVVDRVREMIGNGQIDQALTEVARLPNNKAAGDWIANARSYVMAHNALDRIETAALIDPMADNPPPARDAEKTPTSGEAPTEAPPPAPNSI